MPAASDIRQFMYGQLFQTPTLPNTTFAGKTVVITGGNSGLGFECAKQLVQLKVSTLILGCRDLSKGEAAKHQITASAGNATDIRVWQVDMASYSSVRAFSARISTELSRLDALIANAGISTNKYHIAEGLEQTLTVNVVSTLLLSLLCLPKLKQTAQDTGTPSHLTITGSNVHCFADGAPLVQAPQGKILTMLTEEGQAVMAARYFLSKLILILGVQEMAKQIPSVKETGKPIVILNCPSPGWCKTPLFRQDDGGFWGRNMLKLIGRKGEVGARTLTSAIAAGEQTHGQYLSECQIKPASAWVRSNEGHDTQEKLWKELSDLFERIAPGSTEALAR